MSTWNAELVLFQSWDIKVKVEKGKQTINIFNYRSWSHVDWQCQVRDGL